MKTLPRATLATCSRRQALGLFVAGAGIAVLGVDVAFAAAAPAPAQPVTAYFRDGLLRDPSGRLPAWRAPRGHKGAGQTATMSEEVRLRAGITL